MSDEEIRQCLELLVENVKEDLAKSLDEGNHTTADHFAEQILGFEEVDDEEEDEEGNGSQEMVDQNRTTGMPGINEVIPEEEGF